MQELGAPFGGDNLPAQCEAVAPLLRRAAQKSGGQAPAPEVPAMHELAPLEGSGGNALALEVFDAREVLLARFKEWSARGARLEARLPRWDEWTRLLDLAPELETLDGPRQTRDAMRTNRSLLSDPDPVTPAWNETLDALRVALEGAHRAFGQAQHSEIERLESHALWARLDASTRESLLLKHGLAPVAAPASSGAGQIAAALRACSLANWKTRAAALGAGASAALGEAAQLLAPKSVKLSFALGPHRIERAN